MNIQATPSWILFLGCLGVVFGIGFMSFGVWCFLVGGAFAFVLLFFFVRSLEMPHRIVLAAIMAFGMMIGFGRYVAVGPGANSIANIVGQSAVIEGRIVGLDLNDSGVTYVLDDLGIGEGPVDDRLRVEAPISADASIGDHIRTVCVLEQPQPFDGFRYDRFLAAKSIYAICRPSAAPFILENTNSSVLDRFWIVVGSFHDWIDEKTRSLLPEPQASLLLGLLIGENSFSDTWKEAFQRTGTSHIVAASGYNVAILAEIAMIFFVSIGLYRKQAYPLVVAAIAIFVVLAGAGGAVVRAGIMGILAITARHLGRHASPRNILVFTVVLMLIFEPRLLRDDVGFQLSVMATMGLIFLSDRVASLLNIVPMTFGVRESLASTLAATITTLPVTMFSFGSFSIVAPIVNMFVLPFIPFAMAFGAGALAISSFVPSIGVWIALPAWTMLVTMTSIIGAFASWAHASIPLSAWGSIIGVILCFALIVLVIRFLPRSFERQLDSWNIKRVATLVFLVVALFAVQIGAIAFKSGRLDSALVHVFVFDVGQGDVIFIDGQSQDIVIDGGPTRFGLLEQLARVRFPWERKIDVVIATHPHADHVIGLIGLIRSYEVSSVLQNGSQYFAPAAEAFQRIAPEARIATTALQPIEISSNAALDIFWPRDEVTDIHAADVHERSIVARLTVGEKRMLFTGDAGEYVESKLSDLAPVDVLKVGHHGSDTSSSLSFLQTINPSIAIISVGQGNSYGHPSPFTLGRLESVGARIFRTDQQGTVRIDFTGESVDIVDE